MNKDNYRLGKISWARWKTVSVNKGNESKRRTLSAIHRCSPAKVQTRKKSPSPTTTPMRGLVRCPGQNERKQTHLFEQMHLQLDLIRRGRLTQQMRYSQASESAANYSYFDSSRHAAERVCSTKCQHEESNEPKSRKVRSNVSRGYQIGDFLISVEFGGGY